MIRELTLGMMTGRIKMDKLIESSKDLMDWYQFNDPRNREVECASATGIGTAEALAKVYGIIANGGKTTDGKHLLPEKLIKMIENGGTPMVIDEIIGMPSRISHGFFRLPYQDREMLGHPGHG